MILKTPMVDQTDLKHTKALLRVTKVEQVELMTTTADPKTPRADPKMLETRLELATGAVFPGHNGTSKVSQVDFCDHLGVDRKFMYDLCSHIRTNRKFIG